jgi:hypothetical protein
MAEWSGRWPDFVIGGAPRCGTTFLWSALRQQPGVFMPNKEPHFFASDQRMGVRGERRYGVREVPAYLALFDEAAANDIVGEASTSFLVSQVAVPGLLTRSPDARFVISPRDPIEQLASMHGRFFYGGMDLRALVPALEHELAQGDGPWRSPLAHHPGFVGYIGGARFGEQLERLFSYVRRERVLVVLLDDMASDPGSVLRRVSSFLSIPEPTLSEPPVQNEHFVARSPRFLRAIWAQSNIDRAKRILPRRMHALAGSASSLALRLTRSRRPRDPLPAELVARLRAELADDLALAGKMLGEDLVARWWSNAASDPRV